MKILKLNTSLNPYDGFDDYLCPGCEERHAWRSGDRIGWRCGTVVEIVYKTNESEFVQPACMRRKEAK